MLLERRTYEDVSTLALRTDDGRGMVEISGETGGVVTARVLDGISWLHRNAVMPLGGRRAACRSEPAAERYVRFADVGLGDFCLGTVSADRVSLPGHGALTLPDHGLAWCAGDVVVIAAPDRLITRWRIDALPLRAELSRESILESRWVLRDRYTITGRGEAPFPAYWATQDMLELADDTRYFIAEGTPMIVAHSEGALRLRTDVVHRWPLFTRTGRGTIDLSRPGLIEEPFAAKIFSADPAGTVAIGQRDHRLALSTPGPSHIALWTNNRAWTPRGVTPGSYRHLCVERASAPTDRVSEDRGLRLLGREQSLAFEVVYEVSR